MWGVTQGPPWWRKLLLTRHLYHTGALVSVPNHTPSRILQVRTVAYGPWAAIGQTIRAMDMELRIPELATGAAEAFGPFRTYLLTRGLVVSFHGVEAVVADGVGSSISFPISSEPDEEGLFLNEVYVRHLDEVQNRIGVKFVGFQGASDDGAFRIGDYAFSAGQLGETLLGRLSKLETLIRNRVLKKCGITEIEIMTGMAICANIEENVSHGKVGVAGVELLIDALRKASTPITEAYFIFNATSIAEDLRYALQAACRHFRNLNLGIRKLNRAPASALATTELSAGMSLTTEVDELSYAYTSSGMSYTALDHCRCFHIPNGEPFRNPISFEAVMAHSKKGREYPERRWSLAKAFG